MKFATLFSLLLWAFLSNAQARDIDTATRGAYYRAGMKTSVAHFNASLAKLANRRLQGKLGEADFLQQNLLLSKRYEAQQFLVCRLADSFAQSSVMRSKYMKQSLKVLEKETAAAAYKKMKSSSAAKSIDELSFTDFVFQAQLALLCGYTDDALVLYKKLVHFDTSSLGICLDYAQLLSSVQEDSGALLCCQKAITIAQQDTLKLATIKMCLSKVQENAHDPHAALSSLIEAEYLVRQMKHKDSFGIVLLASVLHQMAKLQLAQNDFDNAVHHAKESVQLLEPYRQNAAAAAFAAHYYTLALVYKVAGGNKEADSLFKQTLLLYEPLLKEYPQRFMPEYLRVVEDYGPVLQWFNRFDAFDSTMRVVAKGWQELMQNHYPFFVLAYANNEMRLGQKLMDVEVKVYLAEAEWKKGKEALLALDSASLMLYGNSLCALLYKQGAVQIALKEPAAALPFLKQSLTFRERMFALAPQENKKEMVDILVQNGTVNAMLQKKEPALLLLDRAIIYANELGETNRVAELMRFKNDVQKN